MLPDNEVFLNFILPAEQSFCQATPYVPLPQRAVIGTLSLLPDNGGV